MLQQLARKIFQSLFYGALVAAVMTPISYARAEGRGGGITAGGGGLITPRGQPWFTGPDPVYYCIEISKDFSADKEVVERTVNAALRDWQATLQRLRPMTFKDNFIGARERGLSLDFVKKRSCENADLKFLFGVFNDEIKTALAYTPENEHGTGFAYITDYNWDTGRAKGIIWVTPDRGRRTTHPHFLQIQEPATLKFKQDCWSEKGYRLFNVLVHELGHIFGLPDIVGTVMDPNIPTRQILVNTPRRKGSGALKLSSSTLLYNFWTLENGPAQVCGKVEGTAALKSTFDVDVKDAPFWVACLETVTPYGQDSKAYLKIGFYRGNRGPKSTPAFEVFWSEVLRSRKNWSQYVGIEGRFNVQPPDQAEKQLSQLYRFTALPVGFSTSGTLVSGSGLFKAATLNFTSGTLEDPFGVIEFQAAQAEDPLTIKQIFLPSIDPRRPIFAPTGGAPKSAR